MTKAGERILEGAREAVAIAKGEQPAARIHMQGHAYVPEADLRRLADALFEIRDGLRADSRVWTLQKDGTRIEGPALAEFINAALFPPPPPQDNRH